VSHASGTPARSLIPELILVAAVAALIWWIKWLVWGIAPLSGDGAMYISMAMGERGVPPWSFHVLTPRIVGLLFPHDPIHGFFAVAGCSFVGTAVTINLLLRRAGFGVGVAERALGVGLFVATCTGANMFRAYYMTDSLSYFLLAVACAGTLYKADWIVALATFAGVFNRETAAFVIPVWIVFNLREPIARIAVRFLLTFSPAVAGYFVLQRTRLILGFEPVHFNYLKFENMLELWRVTLSWLGTENIYYGLAICVFLAYGPVWFMAARGVASVLKRFSWPQLAPLASLWALLLPVLSTLLIVDWRRGFQPLFPAMTVSGVLGIRAMTEGRAAYCWTLLAVATVLAAAITSDAWWYHPMRTPVLIAMVPWLGIAAFVLTRPHTVDRDSTY